MIRPLAHDFGKTFADPQDGDAYQPLPAREAFVGRLEPWLADVLVLDCEAGR